MKYFDTDNMYKRKCAGFAIIDEEVKQALNTLYSEKKGYQGGFVIIQARCNMKSLINKFIRDNDISNNNDKER